LRAEAAAAAAAAAAAVARLSLEESPGVAEPGVAEAAAAAAAASRGSRVAAMRRAWRCTSLAARRASGSKPLYLVREITT
jgi:hypothetical protein